MRILTVSAFYETHGGGIEIVAGATARALARRGHDCRWAASDLDLAPDEPGLTGVPLRVMDPLEHWTGLPMPIPDGDARRRLEQEVGEADAIIIHDALYVTSLLAAHYANRHRKPWLLIQHIGEIPYRSAALRGVLSLANSAITRPLLSRAPQTVFISDVVRRHFEKTAWRTAPHLLFNGVDHNCFRAPSDAERNQLRRKLGMDRDGKQLLFVGRFVEKKGLSALRHLAAANPGWDISIVGSGPSDPREWGLANVHVLGRQQRDELAKLYRAADCLVLPSVGEGFPLVVQEAMACGLPVFCGADSAAADPGAAQFLHGVRVDPADPQGTARRFAAAIEATVLEPSAEAAAYARAAYDWDNNAEWLASRLEELRMERISGSGFALSLATS